MKKALLTLICLAAMLTASMSIKAQEVTIMLKPGWTWISYPSADTVDFATALGTFTPRAGDVIACEYDYSEYFGGEWLGGIQHFYPGYGYMYYSSRNMPVFLTFNAQQPAPQVVVTTSEPMLVTAISAMGGGEVTVSDGTYILVKGLCWATHENPTTNDDFYQEAESGVGSFSLAMTDLNISTTYYVRAYAVTPNGTIYGDQKTFTTRDGIPTLTTAEVTNITGATATCGGNITDNGGLNVTARGVCWSTSSNPTITNSHTTNGNGNGSFSSSITGLDVSTTYYVRAYATTAAGTAYGEEKTFTTRDGIPTLTTAEVTNIQGTTAACGGNITDNGGLNVTARGVCWSTSPNPAFDDIFETYDFENGLIPTNWTNDVTYPWIVNQNTSSGNYCIKSGNSGVDNSTSSIQIMVEFVGAGAVGFDALCQGEGTTTIWDKCIFSIDGEAQFIYGAEVSGWNHYSFPVIAGTHTFEWSYTKDGSVNPTGDAFSIDNVVFTVPDFAFTVVSDSTGSFSSSITCLSVNTTYYVRAYATTNAGTAYGEEVIFITRNGIPEVMTDTVVHVLGIYASCVATVTDDGGLDVIARGVCWSTEPSPTVSNCHTSNGSGLGSFTGRMTGLTLSTTYYVRAYASTSQAIVYGEEMSFTTLEEVGPDIINGAFTVNTSGAQVYFSQGNLQYQASTNTWRFAENQYDYIGDANSNISSTYSGWIDLFGWGTSGYNHGANCYQPWSTSQNPRDYDAYGNQIYNLYDQTGQADWGYNPISNGGNMTNQWRTLTRPEWDYVFNTRTTTSGIRYAKANVNNVNGVILLPDDWSTSTYSLSSTNTSEASFSSNTLTTSQWSTLEQAGAVFLPAAGNRGGTSVNVGSSGRYWSASHSTAAAYSVEFDDNSLGTSYGNRSRCNGYSVRLVLVAE